MFNCAIEAIDYYYLVQLLTPTKLVFFWLAQLNQLVGLSIDPKRIESKNLSDNCGKTNSDMSNRVSVEKLGTEKELLMEEKLKMEDKIKIEDLKSLE